jgi:hypothetical protein
MTVRSTVFWVVMQCSLEKDKLFGATHCLHIQLLRISQANSKQWMYVLLGLLLSYKDGGEMFLQNIGNFLNYIVLNLEESFINHPRVVGLHIEI